MHQLETARNTPGTAIQQPESRLDYALKYIKLGWPVLPLHWITDNDRCSCGKPDCKPGKHPLTKNGVKDATINPEVITTWFSRWPYANIGIATGKVSGILALDIDPRHGGDDSLDVIIQNNGRIPDDVMAITGSGGKHYLFKYPEKIGRCSTNLWPGIDTRGDGGYIVVAPSNHISGNAYFWDAEADPLDGAVLPNAPDWLLNRLSDTRKQPAITPAIEKPLTDSEIKRIRKAFVYIPADDREQWRTVGMALHASGAGDQAFGLWCEWSQQSDKFNLKDQRRVWDSFKADGGITLAALFGIAKANGYVPPETRPPEPPLSAYEAGSQEADNAKNPGKAKQRKRAEKQQVDSNAVLKLLKRYVFLKNHNRIYDTVTRNELSRDGFDGSYLHIFPSDKPSEIFLTDPEAVKVDGLIYLPGEKHNPVKRNGAVLWNIWRKPDISLPDEATREDVETWLEHLDYLYPVQSEQNHILDWMASTLQFPQTKINHALLIAGTSRVGKDMLLNPLRYGLGAANVCEPPAGELKESFTDYLHHSKLVIFQEIQTFEGLNLENKLKPMLAAPPDMLRVRLFGRGFYETPNIVQAVFMSNYRDALHISEGDGRYFTVWTSAKPLSKDYYSDLWQWLEDRGNGLVVRWLLSRDISGFNPKAPAPLTRFKSLMMETSKSSLRQQIEDMVAAMDYPFNVDCVRSLDVYKVMREKYSSKSIASVLTEIGCSQRECRRSGGKREKFSLFAVRNDEQWQAVSSIKWIDEYDKRKD
ncbi:MAG: bifunctional DNA primase/polymerase [Methylovulum sp.]|nr:bifunctional DNA primase/polymerase [Methylovulum sp.]